MSKRLQVLLDDEEYEEIQAAARRSRTTMSEWVRDALRRVRRLEPSIDADRKLAVVRAAYDHSAPTADIHDMLAYIERGRLGDIARGLPGDDR